MMVPFAPLCLPIGDKRKDAGLKRAAGVPMLSGGGGMEKTDTPVCDSLFRAMSPAVMFYVVWHVTVTWPYRDVRMRRSVCK